MSPEGDIIKEFQHAFAPSRAIAGEGSPRLIIWLPRRAAFPWGTATPYVL